MTASVAARRPLVFAALAVAAVAAEYAVVASRGFALHPTGFSAAVIFDLVVGLPLAWWLLVVRPGAARPRSLVPVALAGLAVAAALLPGQRGLLRGLRFLAIPAEVALVVAVLRRFSGARATCRTACAPRSAAVPWRASQPTSWRSSGSRSSPGAPGRSPGRSRCTVAAGGPPSAWRCSSCRCPRRPVCTS